MTMVVRSASATELMSTSKVMESVVLSIGIRGSLPAVYESSVPDDFTTT